MSGVLGASSLRFRGWARLLLATCLLPVAPCLAAPFDFGPVTHIRGALTNNGEAVAIGDLNGDGRNDIAISQGNNVVWLHLQTASGQLQAPQSNVVPTIAIRTLKTIDIDGDGANELLVGHGSGLSVRAPSGTWRHVSALVVCEQLATGDINLDGWLDVACLGTTGYMSLYFNDRTGGFSAPTYLWTPANANGIQGNVNQLQLRDVTGDGLPDLVAMASLTAGFYVHPHDGSDGFLAAYGYPHATLSYMLGPYGVAVIDVDGDGVDEIITTSGCNTPCASLHVHRRDALGFFRHVEDIPTHDIPASPMVYDIDRDGYMDLLVPHSGWSSVSRYMGSAQGLAREAVRSTVPIASPTPSAFSLGDINGDRCTDLVVGNSFGMSVLRGRCVGTASDFDGDGVADVLWRNVASGENTIWRAGADMTWGVAGPLDTQPVRAVTDMAWHIAGQGDFDGDGRSDILWRHASTGANTIWKAADHGRQLPVTDVTDVRWQVAGVGDFDGDGRSDILWRHSATGANVIWKGANHATQQPVTGVTDVRWQVAGVADFNGDGMADVLWRHATSGANAIWNSANNAAQQPVTGVTDARWQVAGVGDFDGDARADILWRHATSGRNAIWKAADSRTQQPVSTVSNVAWKVAAVADYDGDGRSDLFWRDTVTGTNVIWLVADHQAQVPMLRLSGAGWNVARQ